MSPAIKSVFVDGQNRSEIRDNKTHTRKQQQKNEIRQQESCSKYYYSNTFKVQKIYSQEDKLDKKQTKTQPMLEKKAVRLMLIYMKKKSIKTCCQTLLAICVHTRYGRIHAKKGMHARATNLHSLIRSLIIFDCIMDEVCVRITTGPKSDHIKKH